MNDQAEQANMSGDLGADVDRIQPLISKRAALWLRVEAARRALTQGQVLTELIEMAIEKCESD